jgi:hypothetical protein
MVIFVRFSCFERFIVNIDNNVEIVASARTINSALPLFRS